MSENINSLWANLAIEELSRLGCTLFCIAPGSRSAPLTLAAAKNKQVQRVVFYDERSLGFFALGYAKTHKSPACIIVSSGTAVANLLPSVIEASLENIPLIVLSADRPAILFDSGANQTIDQCKIFGSFVRWHSNLTPSDAFSSSKVLSLIDYAFYKSTAPIAGPVHLNWHFDEPLALTAKKYDTQAVKDLDQWHKKQTPHTSYFRATAQLCADEITQLATAINHSEKGLIVVGALACKKDQDAIKKLAQKLKAPVIADVTGGMGNLALPAADKVIKKIATEQGFLPDLVLQFGGRLVSKHLPLFIKNCRPKMHIFIDENHARLDPENSISHKITANISSVLEALEEKLLTHKSSMFLHNYQNIADKLDQDLEKNINHEKRLSQRFIARHLSTMLTEEHIFFIGNSMPIRACNLFAHLFTDTTIVVNRGASGIDGNLSTAAGAAHQSGKRLVALVGDLTFLHDSNGLGLLKNCEQPALIIVANNQGGGIFSFLPIAQEQEFFSPYFDSPPKANLFGLSSCFGIRHICVSTKEDFLTAIAEANSTNEHIVLEALCDTDADLAIELAA